MTTVETYPIDGEQMADFALRLVDKTSLSGEEGEVAELVATEMKKPRLP